MHLYNRPEIIDILIRRLNSFAEGYRQNIAIIGEPHIGKTSLIKNLLDSDEIKMDSIIPIYIESKIEPFEYCIKRFIKSAVSQLLKSDPSITTLPVTLLLIEVLQRSYPKTAQICLRVLQDMEKNKADEAFSFMLDIPAAISEETKKRCVLIIDEFQNLSNFSLKHPFGAMAKKIMIQKDTMYILVSSKRTISQRIIDEKLFMLFGNFEKIFLQAFDINTARAFLKGSIKTVNFPDVCLDFISIFCGSNPLYMKIICDEIERAVCCKKIPDSNFYELLESAITEAVFKKTGVINHIFLSAFLKISEGKLLSKTAGVLLALSSKNKKPRDIAKSAKIQIRDAAKVINKLTEMDIITRNGTFYNFRDKLFSYWLQTVYLKKILSFSIDETLEEDYFKKELSSQIEAFIIEYKKEFNSKIIDLFKLFRNDIIQLNGKRHKLIPFNRVEKLEGETENIINIIAANDELKWLCTIKKDHISENDITSITDNAKKIFQNNRINKHILICASGINENAYLMAKESKLWIWDIKSLNMLMELYGKPQVKI